MDATVRTLVRHRAGNRCEYCLLQQAQLPFATFHVEHITMMDQEWTSVIGTMRESPTT